MKVVRLAARVTSTESSSLVAVCNEAEEERGPIEIDASECTMFGPMGIAALGASFAVRRRSGRPTTLLDPLNAEASAFLKEVGLSKSLRGEPAVHGTLELRQLMALDALYTDSVARVLERGVPGITEENSYPIQLCLNELLQNVFEWSHSPVGCFVLTRWYKKTQSVRLAVVDRGIGIPAALRKHQIQGLHRAGDAQVIEAAVTQPKLTSRSNQVGGLGLKTIREMACDRGGSLTVVSLGAKVRWSGKKISRHRSPPFRGTAIEIDFRPDAPVEPRSLPSIF